MTTRWSGKDRVCGELGADADGVQTLILARKEYALSDKIIFALDKHCGGWRSGSGCDFIIHFGYEGYHTPATMYRRNGDPGDPEEGDEERLVTSLEIASHEFPTESEVFKTIMAEYEGNIEEAVDAEEIERDSDGPEYERED